MKYTFLLIAFLGSVKGLAQQAQITGRIFSTGAPLAAASIISKPGSHGTLSDSLGYFTLRVPPGQVTLHITAIGKRPEVARLQVRSGKNNHNFDLKDSSNLLADVVITGTLKEVKRLESPVPVEVYTPAFFRKNPTPNIFDALQNVNGVRPQLNCNICNTGDIHINGLEGPYTMVLIDGMPIVSSLSSVYGLSGIPNSLVERIEIVKGPASSLYGSEAVGGLINIITKKPQHAPLLSIDAFSTSWKELNADVGLKFMAGKKTAVLTGINYFNYQQPRDENNDGFTDVTLQHRVSVFQKWNTERKDNRHMSVALRYFNEDRWGGETNWTKKFRGTDSVYGESIYTSRWEMIGKYQLPVPSKWMFSFSFNDHKQDSRYGTVSYVARQKVAFGQLTWDKTWKQHDFLFGTAIRYTYYDDNTVSTRSGDSIAFVNQPQKIMLPGIFVQDEWKLSEKSVVLAGLRYDHNSIHGSIITPRFAYKYTPDHRYLLRLNAGTGYRVVNLFTEDHAALTGARTIEIRNTLKPEKSYNLNLGISKKIFSTKGTITHIDLTAWYTYFNNRIIGDYEKDPDKIIYDNLAGYASSKGISMNVDMTFLRGFKLLAGMNLQEVSTHENNKRTTQLLTEKFSGTWALSYKFKKAGLTIDYTGNLYGPMRLPVLGPLDPRAKYSPAWSIQNLQFSYSKKSRMEFYAGIKNLLNWTPNKGNPFIIARSHDPFDKQVSYDPSGKVIATAENPYALSFDPNYVYAPNQGLRAFAGFRFTLK